MPAFPRRKPLIQALSADAEGRIWVEVYTRAIPRDVPARAAADQRPSLPMQEPNAYDVCDDRGRKRAAPRVPAVPDASGRRAAGLNGIQGLQGATGTLAGAARILRLAG